MSRYHHNIEPSGFHRGRYVGYGAGRVWRVMRHGKGERAWIAVPLQPGSPDRDQRKPDIYATTLRDISAKLEAAKA
jgi:hypothetical protein